MKFTSSIHTLAALAGLAASAPLDKAAETPEQLYARYYPIALRELEEHVNATSQLSKRATDAPFGIKKGLAYNDGSITPILSKKNSATWAYNWGTADNAKLFQSIPMCWGPKGCPAPEIKAKIAGGDTPWVLGYNEPDMVGDWVNPDTGVKANLGGSDTSPQDAYNAWGNQMFPFRDAGSKLVCPGVTSYNDAVSKFTGRATGLAWLRQFLSTGGNKPEQFRCDAQALHWYGPEGMGLSGAAQAQLFIDYMTMAHGEVNAMFGRDMPIWVTEFAPSPREDANLFADFLTVAIPWLNGQSWVDRYAPHMAENLVSNGGLNAAGQAFVNTM